MRAPSPDPRPADGSRLRRWGKRLGVGTLSALGIYLFVVGFGWMNPSVPFDVLLNLGDASPRPGLRAPADGRERLVVLQHGLWRSAASLRRLERALEQHGYRVLNESYPSTSGTLEQHAARLRETLESAIEEMPRPPDELYLVGHSMGGLVMQAYLARPDARVPDACVYIATPHRGAVLCDLRKDWIWFRLLMGDEAALQLSPGDAFHRREIPMPCPVGTVVGGLGNGEGFHSSIPGDDDGTVAVAEARLEGETDCVRIPVGHTRITVDERVIRQVLHFLRHLRFEH